MTGVKKIENGKISVQIIINKIKEIYKKYPKIVEDEFSIDTLCMKKFSIALINSDYNISYNINRTNLHKILNKQYNVFSTFDACEYPGVNVKMYWNKNNIEGSSFSGKCPCKVKCIGKGNGEGEGQCKMVTIFAFQSGSIMITGARCIEQIYSGYNFINSIFERHRDELEIKLPAFVINQKNNEKKEKKKKGIIYFHKDKVRNLKSVSSVRLVASFS
jgi:TATA-box binding protein (TBP) (component of TFIID and TFIIIB)